MTFVFKMLNAMPLLLICIFVGIAFARVHKDESIRASQPQVPRPVGASQREASFPSKVWQETSQVWLEFYAAILPGITLPSLGPDRVNPNTLDALKTRTSSRYSKMSDVEAPRY